MMTKNINVSIANVWIGFRYFVKEIVDQYGDSSVVEESVHEEGPLEEFEFGKGEIGRPGSVSTLFAKYPEPDVRLLDH